MTTYTPGPVLLAAQKHLGQLRKNHARLNRNIHRLMASRKINYDTARRLVLGAKGLLR